MKKCYIFGAGEGIPKKFQKLEGDIVIAADGGLKYTNALEIKPDVILGDFDSLGEIPKGENVLCYPVKKNDTDTMLAIKKGFEMGYSHFVIYGGTGKRFDHTIANIQSLSYISKKGGIGFLYHNDFVATVIKNRALKFKSSSKGYISLFSQSSKVEGLSIKGLLYSGENLSLNSSFPLGISNEFIGEACEISVKKGQLLVIWQKGAVLND